MDIDRPQPPRPEIAELMRHLGGRGQDIARLRLDHGIADLITGAALDQDEGLGIGGDVQNRALADLIGLVEGQRVS